MYVLIKSSIYNFFNDFRKLGKYWIGLKFYILFLSKFVRRLTNDSLNQVGNISAESDLLHM